MGHIATVLVPYGSCLTLQSQNITALRSSLKIFTPIFEIDQYYIQSCYESQEKEQSLKN